MPSPQPSKLRVAIIAALAGGIAGPVVSILLQRWIDSLYPTLQRVQSVEPLPLAHLRPLRKDFPPLPFMLQFQEASEFRQPQIIGERRESAWIFRVAVANLTPDRISGVDVRILHSSAQRGTRYGLRPRSKAEQLLDGTLAESGVWTFHSDPNLPLGLTLGPIPSGQANFFEIAVIAPLRPSMDDLKLSIACAEGKFSQLTPSQWDAIGWTGAP